MIKPFVKAVIAGWSSQVARRAHNPEVARFESRPRNQIFGISAPPLIPLSSKWIDASKARSTWLCCRECTKTYTTKTKRKCDGEVAPHIYVLNMAT